MGRDRYRTVSGLAFVGVGAVAVLGFVTAAALYPDYSVAHQTISALGAAGAPASSRAVFNAAMVASGVLTLLAAYCLNHVYGRRLLTGAAGLTGVGSAGVGLFPAQTGVPHFVAAVLTFGGVGVTALVVADTVRGPFGSLSAVLGALELVAFGLFLTLAGANPLGVGGLERWVAYLGVVWAIAFGGFLLPTEPEQTE